VKHGWKSASYPRSGCSRWGIALAGRTRHLLYRSPPNSASSPTRLSPPVSGGETRTKGSALAGQASPPPRGLSRAVRRRGAAERPWTLPGEARAEVSQLYPSRVQSVGHSSSRAHKAPAVWVAAQHRFKADAATPPVSGGETRAEGSALAGEASHPPRGLSRAVRRRGAAERPWTLPGAARAEVSQLYPSRVQSAGHSSSGAVKSPAIVGRRPTSLQADAAAPPVSGGETRAKGAALAGRALHPPCGLSRGVRR